MELQHLDPVLVPLGLLLMVSYHLWLFYRIAKRPTTTVIGINAINRRIWVQSMMEDPAKNGILAVQTLRNSIMASTLLASTAITLCSVITMMMAGGSNFRPPVNMVLGGRSGSYFDPSIKFFAIVVCFLLAFLFNLQSIRYYSHASLLVNVPLKRNGGAAAAAAEYVAKTLNWGGYFWSIGLRAFYFSLPLFLWVFGPVPMASCCLVTVIMLYFIDVYKGWGEEEKAEQSRVECVNV